MRSKFHTCTKTNTTKASIVLPSKLSDTIFHSVSYKSIKYSHCKPQKSKVLFYDRLKQNQIITKFNQRKNNLKKIYNENQSIYKKIITKKSLYSKQQLNKSTSSLNSSIRSRNSSFSLNKSNISKKSNKSKSNSISRFMNFKSSQIPRPNLKVIKVNINELANAKIQQLKHMFARSSNTHRCTQQNLPAFTKKILTQRQNLVQIKQKPSVFPKIISKANKKSVPRLRTQSLKQIDNKIEQPLDTLKVAVGKVVNIKTRDRTNLKGKLVGYDAHFNIMLSHLQLKRSDGQVQKHNVTYVRGDGVIFISIEQNS